MTLVFAVLAQGVSIDQFSNRLSLFNVMEGIEAPRFPVVISEIAFVSVLRREEGNESKFDAKLTVRIGSTLIGQAMLGVDFGDKINTRLIANFQGLPILEPGNLEFLLELPNGDPVRVSIQAVQSPAPMLATTVSK